MSSRTDAEWILKNAIFRLLEPVSDTGLSRMSSEELLHVLARDRPELELSQLADEIAAVERQQAPTSWEDRPVRMAEESPRIHHAPGWRLLVIAEILFSRKVRAEVLEPTVRDLQQEHLEALAAGRLSQARWVVYRGYWSFWSTVVAQIPVSLLRKAYDLWKATGGES